MCTSPISVYRKRLDGSISENVVPCGRCSECRAKAQSEFAALSVLEANECGSIGFFTLTYRDESVPSMYCILEKGEIVNSNLARGNYGEYDTEHYSLHLSLCRADVQKVLKRFRQDYFRREGKRLDLRYTLFGEYGERTARPHYHMLFYGVSESDCHRFGKMWLDAFGFYDMKYIKHFNSDGSDAFEIVSRYVSKYISKGDFLPAFVKDGKAEKPRRQSSIRLGVRNLDIEKLKNFTWRPMSLQ